MVNRLFNPLKSRSFFIFGPRGVGKSTWLRAHFLSSESLFFNLLEPETYELFLLQPQRLKEIINLKENLEKVIIIDEIQKVPSLLDIVHNELSQKKEFLF